ncbi:MAG: right-handed parallel beta-helix repeat-containing protein [Candidatus Sulfopaludibacter sp.]|nr:right-handed parallel beta-helix repeat-containing protein [Candidatus Sulfopaludibacter sp.]
MIQRAAFAVLLCMAAAAFLMRPVPRRRVVQLPRGILYLKSEMAVEGGTELHGAPGGSVLRFAPGFAGRALIVVKGPDVVLRDFSIEGNRGSDARTGLPPYDTPFVRFTHGNGILAAAVSRLRIENVRFREVAGFAVLISGVRDVAIDRVQVRDSGSGNALGRNNATGGILLEEGTRDFRVTRCEFANVRGNGIWTHSLYTSPRNANGLIAQNRFAVIGRDAIQVGHATDVRVAENAGRAIGFPIDAVDVEGRAVPVAIDTAGNVERCSYTGNHFEEIDGKCIDLDGFHDGEIRANVCVNRAPPGQYRFGNYGIVMNNSNPDMQSCNIRVVDNLIDGPLFGGIFVIGTGHRIAGNRLVNLNTAHCGCSYSASDPDILSSGIYLGRGAERPAPARGNLIEDNEIQGFQMKTRCIVNAPGISSEWNTVRGNRCEQ